MKKILTHSGSFHCDELFAIALIKIFVDDEIVVERINAPQPTADYDFVVDVGGKFDGIQFFDHHQNKELPAAAMLVWQYIKDNYLPQISPANGFFKILNNVIEKVSAHDVSGIHKDDGLISLISALNNKQGGFNDALNILYLLLKNICDNMSQEEEKLKRLSEAEVINGFAIYNAADLPQNWREVVAKGVVSVNLRGGWNVISKDTNVLILPESPRASFRHNSGFMIVFPEKTDAIEYIKNL